MTAAALGLHNKDAFIRMLRFLKRKAKGKADETGDSLSSLD